MIKKDNKPQSHLINILKSTADHHPNFVLFLGAGASKTSGVKMATDMIEEWRDVYRSMYTGEEEGIEKQSWFEQPEEYSILFESLFDQPSQRRECIESFLNGAKPSWGYIYLVNLLKHRVFDTVFTTNFDDLLNESCYQFSDDVRPIVCAHDSSIKNVRLTTKRPKIVKFHGDFLFDDIKNTLTELETLEDNMKDKFRQFAGEYGMIFVGYSGNDRSIMDLMDLLLKSESNFPHGIYWCIRKGSKTNERVDMLRRFSKFKVVEIEGFDEFFAEIHDKMNISLQDEVVDPYGALVKRLKNLIENINMPGFDDDKSSRIQKDSELIWNKISNLKNENMVVNPDEMDSVSLSDGNVEFDLPIPFRMLSQVQQRAGNGEKAVMYMIKEVELRPSHRSLAQLFESIWKNNKPEFAEKAMELLEKNREVVKEHASSLTNMALPMIHVKKYEIADKILDMASDLNDEFKDESFRKDFYILNKMQIKAHQKIKFSDEEIIILEKLKGSEDLSAKMGACILLDEFEEAKALVRSLVEEQGFSVHGFLLWPIVHLIPNIEEYLSSLSPDEKFAKKVEGSDVKPFRRRIPVRRRSNAD